MLLLDGESMLQWMTHHHLPLQLMREADGLWVVVDGSSDIVKGSGEGTFEALQDAIQKERERDE